MWLGQRTILPERSFKRDTKTRNNDDTTHPTSRFRSRLRQRGFWPLGSPESVQKAVHSEEAREVKEGAVPDPSRIKASARDDGSGNGDIQGDIEKLGGAVEAVEKEHGQEGGVAARLAREIKLVSEDLGKQPPKEYDWEDWKRWMQLLSDSNGSNNKNGLGGLKSLGSPTRSAGVRSSNASSATNDDGERSSNQEWIWLGDDGPLFTNESEAKWILGKLCDRLEKAKYYSLKIVKSQPAGSSTLNYFDQQQRYFDVPLYAVPLSFYSSIYEATPKENGKTAASAYGYHLVFVQNPRLLSSSLDPLDSTWKPLLGVSIFFSLYQASRIFCTSSLVVSGLLCPDFGSSSAPRER
ncbi:hypothetical protein F5050DRAFT_1898489 [Lentinula boryana]|uniref:Uncharacterized protein n=1 Tax=Lentinula boryana TaxID=40481 RepID=A0ABQ8PYS5_9AGAR|nr:hypothetical protein F5050DRAFT_1898489 [Lentinula boryana]